MADFNSSLPVRTQTAGDVQSCLVDYTNPTTQGAKVDTHGSQYAVIANAAGVATTSQANGAQQALDVGINVAGVQIDPRQIRALLLNRCLYLRESGYYAWRHKLPDNRTHALSAEP